MTNKDKVLAAFLVSVGFFSIENASKYVQGLTDTQKSDLCIVATSGVVVTDTEPSRILPPPTN